MIVIDDFIRDENLLEEIQNDPTFFSDVGCYYWWDGWWSSQAQSTRQKVVQYLWENIPLPSPIETLGFEYWTGITQPGDGKTIEDNGVTYHLGPHFDKDEDLFSQTGEILSGQISSVFYPSIENDYCEGGHLKIWEPDGYPNGEYELIKPKFNRFVVFDIRCVHAVLEVTKGVRKAIAINLWDKYPTNYKSLLR